MTRIDLRPAVSADFAAVASLLDACGLPLSGVGPEAADFVVATSRDGLAGCAGLERYGPFGLLRSVAVAAGARRQGLGARLTEAIVEEARRQGLSAIYALTTTAQDYFPRLGFEVIDRDDVPAEVRASEQFSALCPSTAVALRRVLRS